MLRRWCILLAMLGLTVGMAVTAGNASAATTAGTFNPGGLIHLAGGASSHGTGVSHVTSTTSTNWSGYAATTGTYTSVSASWTQPKGTCTSGDQYAAFWVGLDGYSSSSVEQTGTDADCLASGAPNYYAWYEMYPAGAVDLSPSTYPVTPGDHIAAAVKSNTAGTSFTLALVDTSTQHKGWMFSTTAASNGLPRSSAEWIAEAPTSCSLIIFCSTVGLSNFGSVTFTNAQATDVAGKTGSISSFTDTPLQMASNGTVEATPSALSAAGASFSDTWSN
jgi:Peptidase A4 family